MSLGPAIVLALAAHCSPAINPTTMVALAKAESDLDPFVIGVNRPRLGRVNAATAADAATTAQRLIALGYNLDLGLGQINSRNLSRLGLSIEAAFDPCRNLAAAGQLLREGYKLGRPDRIGPQAALRIAFSYYNTGRLDRGFANGYVSRVTGETRCASAIVRPSNPIKREPTWSAFATIVPDGFVLHPTPNGDAP